jgi:hypothetical protein
MFDSQELVVFIKAASRNWLNPRAVLSDLSVFPVNRFGNVVCDLSDMLNIVNGGCGEEGINRDRHFIF